MADAELNVVTGVSGFSGKHITRLLLANGKPVLNLTGHPERPTEFGEQVMSVPFDFGKPAELTKSLQGATTLYNTYWIRFAHGDVTFEKAVANSRTLIKAAEDAGVRRIVHVSITNPSFDSPLPYFKGKALVEDAIRESRLSYAILRPAVIFGDQGILINNIAWFLRKTPVFGIPGSGDYQLQPILAEDLAELAVAAGRKDENIVEDAVGPEVYSFNDLMSLLAHTVGSKTLIVHLNPELALLATQLLGRVLGDVVLTRDEVKGLEANLLVSEHAPTGHTRLSNWLDDNANWIGTRYMSELKKHYG